MSYWLLLITINIMSNRCGKKDAEQIYVFKHMQISIWK